MAMNTHVSSTTVAVAHHTNLRKRLSDLGLIGKDGARMAESGARRHYLILLFRYLLSVHSHEISRKSESYVHPKALR